MMDEKLKEFLERDSTLKTGMAEGKDVYALLASMFYHNRYEDNLEYVGPDTAINYEGKRRRDNMKRLVLAAFTGDSKYLTEFDPTIG